MNDLISALSKTKPKNSCGLDLISYRMLKLLPENELKALQSIFSDFLNLNTVPQIWKTAKITVITKKPVIRTI